MMWKTVLLPLVSLVMLVVNVVQLTDRLARPESGSLGGLVLMTLVWLALLVFSLRFSLSRVRPKKKRAEEKKKSKERKPL